jgi:hypothetical protein
LVVISGFINIYRVQAPNAADSPSGLRLCDTSGLTDNAGRIAGIASSAIDIAEI